MSLDNQFLRVAISLALVSIGIIGVMLAGTAIFGESAENAKKQLGNIVFGLVLLIIGGLVISIVVR